MNNQNLHTKKPNGNSKGYFSLINVDSNHYVPSSVLDANAVDNNSPGIYAIEDDDSLYDGEYINNYGLGWYNDSNNGGVTGYISGWYGVNLFTGSSPRLSINSTGQVGVNKTSPTAMFEVQGGSANWDETTPGTTVGSIHLDPGNTTNDYGSAITWGASDSSDGNSAQAGIYVRSDGLYGTKLYIATTDNYVSGSKTRIMVNNNGNVGIGLTNPTERLEVQGNAKINGILQLSQSNANYVFTSSSTSTYQTTFNMNDTGLYIGHNSSLRNLSLQTNSTDRITITGAGLVGINDTTPGYTLDVGGSVRSTGSFYAADGSSSAPAFRFYNDTNTGIYRPATDSLRIVTGGGTQLDVQSSTTYSYNTIAPGGTNTYNLGSSSLVWATVYRTAESTGSDRKLKKNIDYSTLGLDFLNNLKPASWNWNGYLIEDDGKQWQGLIAQDVQDALLSIGINPDSWAGIIDNGDYLGLNYEQFIGPIIQSIQDVDAKVIAIENQLNNQIFSDINQISAQSISTDELTVTVAATITDLKVTNNLEVAMNLTVEGDTTVADIYVNGHIISGGDSVTAVLGESISSNTGAEVVVDGNDTAGSITFKTGSETIPAGILAEIEFSNAYNIKPKIIISATNQDAALSDIFVDGNESDATKFVITSANELSPDTVYTFNYFVIE